MLVGEKSEACDGISMFEVFLRLLLWVQKVPEDKLVITLARGDSTLSIAGSNDSVYLALVECLLLRSGSSRKEVNLSFEGSNRLKALVEETYSSVESDYEHTRTIVPEKGCQGSYIGLEGNFFHEFEGSVSPNFNSTVIGSSSKHVLINKSEAIDATSVSGCDGLCVVDTAEVNRLLSTDTKAAPVH
jgi:hypothetical protein